MTERASGLGLQAGEVEGGTEGAVVFTHMLLDRRRIYK